MDVVYILGSGSPRDNEEIKYSIRSLAENMLDLGNIYIVGDLPDFLQGCKHISASDPFPEKWKNAYHKVLEACNNEEISDEFLLMNDDFFMLEPFEAKEFPFYALKNSSGGACGFNSFHVHCPIRINKEWYKKMPFDLNGKSCKSPRTFYANFYKAPPLFCNDFILRTGDTSSGFFDQISKWPCFSISDSTMRYEPFYSWLKTVWKEPSRFETF